MGVSVIFWFQLVWGLCACGLHTVNFFHLVGDSVSAKRLKDIIMYIPYVYPLRGHQDPAPWLHYFFYCIKCADQFFFSWSIIALLFLDSSSLFSASPPSLISNHLNLSSGTQGRSWRLNEPISSKQETETTERLLCPGAPRGPAWCQQQLP